MLVAIDGICFAATARPHSSPLSLTAAPATASWMPAGGKHPRAAACGVLPQRGIPENSQADDQCPRAFGHYALLTPLPTMRYGAQGQRTRAKAASISVTAAQELLHRLIWEDLIVYLKQKSQRESVIQELERLCVA
jgi:hypothetical protein